MVELLLAICYSPLVAKSAGFLAAKKDYSLALTSQSCFVSTFLTNWLDFTKTIIPLALMASESIAHSAFGLMGYWLRAHSGSFRHTKIGARANVYPSLVEERYQYSETMKNNIVTHGRRAWILSVLLGLILGGVIAWTAWNSQILPVVFGVLIGRGALLIIGGLVYFRGKITTPLPFCLPPNSLPFRRLLRRLSTSVI